VLNQSLIETVQETCEDDKCYYWKNEGEKTCSVLLNTSDKVKKFCNKSDPVKDGKPKVSSFCVKTCGKCPRTAMGASTLKSSLHPNKQSSTDVFLVPIVVIQSHAGDPDGPIQSAQSKVVENRNFTDLAITDDLSGFYHYDPAGYIVIGYRCFEQMRLLLTKKGSLTTRFILPGTNKIGDT